VGLNVGELYATLDLDADPFRKSLDRSMRTAEQQGQRMARIGDRMSVGLTLPIAAAFTKLTGDASDLNEVVNQSEHIFGTATSMIGNFAERAAKGLGQSERAAREAANTFGLFFINAGKSQEEAAGMSMTLTTLASDMASFANTKPEEAVEALGAALRGESEPIRRYGVMLDDATLKQRAMSMGLTDTTTGVLPPAIRMQAAYAEILAQTGTIQGDFERTSGDLANQQRILAAEMENTSAKLGQELLPYVLKGAQFATGLVEAFGNLPPTLQTAVVAFAALLAITGPVMSAGGRMVANWHKLSDAFGTGAGGANKLGRALGALGIAGAVTGLVMMGREMNKTTVDVDKLSTALADLNDAEAEQMQETLRLASQWGDLEEIVRQTADGNVKAADRLLEQAAAAGITGEELDRLKAIVEDKRKSDRQAAKDQEDYARELEATTGATEDQRGAVEQLSEAYDSLLSAVLSQFDADVAYRRSLDQTEDALASLHELQKAGKEGTEEYQRALLDVEDAMLGQASSAAELAVKQAEANGEVLDGKAQSEIYRAELVKLRDSMAPGSPLWNALDGHIRKIDSIPDTAHTTAFVDTAAANRAIDDLLRKLSTLKSGAQYSAGAAINQWRANQELDTGGPVLGPKGSPQMVLAHAGEIVLPTHRMGLGEALQHTLGISSAQPTGAPAQAAGRTQHIEQLIVQTNESPRQWMDEGLWRVAGPS